MSTPHCGNRRNGSSGKLSKVLMWKCIKQMKNSFGKELPMHLSWEAFFTGGHTESVTHTLIRCKNFGAFLIPTSPAGKLPNRGCQSEFHCRKAKSLSTNTPNAKIFCLKLSTPVSVITKYLHTSTILYIYIYTHTDTHTHINIYHKPRLRTHPQHITEHCRGHALWPHITPLCSS